MLVWQGEHCVWQIACQRRQIFPEEIKNRGFFIGVSLRSPKFSNKWLRGILADIMSLNGYIRLCLVDLPYFSNECPQGDAEAQKRYLIDFRKECDNQDRRLARLASEFPSRIEIIRWSDIERLVPAELFRELRAAFRLRKRVYESLIEQIRLSVKKANVTEDLDRASIFLQWEFPVLIYLYYGLFTELVDVYPGPQARFFWELERGTFAVELPIATRLAQDGDGLVYADVALRTD